MNRPPLVLECPVRGEMDKQILTTRKRRRRTLQQDWNQDDMVEDREDVLSTAARETPPRGIDEGWKVKTSSETLRADKRVLLRPGGSWCRIPMGNPLKGRRPAWSGVVTFPKCTTAATGPVCTVLTKIVCLKVSLFLKVRLEKVHSFRSSLG